MPCGKRHINKNRVWFRNAFSKEKAWTKHETEHDLCAYPPALFELTRSMQKSDKPPLATAIADFVKTKPSAAVIWKKKTEKFVLDGDFSWHLIPREKNIRY